MEHPLLNITSDNKARKHWHNLEAELSKEDLCPNCHKGVLVQKIAFAAYNDDSVTYGECNHCGYQTL